MDGFKRVLLPITVLLVLLALVSVASATVENEYTIDRSDLPYNNGYSSSSLIVEEGNDDIFHLANIQKGDIITVNVSVLETQANDYDADLYLISNPVNVINAWWLMTYGVDEYVVFEATANGTFDIKVNGYKTTNPNNVIWYGIKITGDLVSEPTPTPSEDVSDHKFKVQVNYEGSGEPVPYTVIDVDKKTWYGWTDLSNDNAVREITTGTQAGDYNGQGGINIKTDSDGYAEFILKESYDDVNDARYQLRISNTKHDIDNWQKIGEWDEPGTHDLTGDNAVEVTNGSVKKTATPTSTPIPIGPAPDLGKLTECDLPKTLDWAPEVVLCPIVNGIGWVIGTIASGVTSVIHTAFTWISSLVGTIFEQIISFAKAIFDLVISPLQALVKAIQKVLSDIFGGL